MSKTNLSFWKKGALPTVSTLNRLAVALGVSVTDLLADDAGSPRQDAAAPPS